MQTHPVVLDVPEGYCLCPYPKSWLRENEKIYFRFPEGLTEDKITLKVVLTCLSSHRALIDWMTTYSGVKGSREFLVGLRDDHFDFTIRHNNEKYVTVFLLADNVRLYAKAFNKQSSNR